MKFKITRTSDYKRENKPVPCANFDGELPSFEAIDCYGVPFKGPMENSYSVEINTLEELIDFIKNPENDINEIIFNGESIEIYDDYRE